MLKRIVILILLVAMTCSTSYAAVASLKHNAVGDELTNAEYHADAYGETGVHEGSASDATIIVAASDSLNKQRADYVDGTQLVCDGTADDVEVQSALTAVSSGGGGKVVLLPGNYNFTSTVSIGNNTILSMYGATIKIGKATPSYVGCHTGSDNASALTASYWSWTTNELTDYYVYNYTDGSIGDITANTATTVTATLSGGTDNDWDVNDIFYICSTHTGSNNQTTTLTDSSASWTAGDLVGLTVINATDKSSGTITANTTNTLTVSSLSGGTDNDFDTNDRYAIQNKINPIQDGGTGPMTILGGTINGNRQAYGSIIYFTEVTDFRIKDMYIYDCANSVPMYFKGNRNGKIINNRIENVKGSDTTPAIGFISTTGGISNKEITVADNYIYNVYGEGIDVNKDDSKILITNNYIRDVTKEGIDSGGGINTQIIGNYIFNSNTTCYAILPPWNGVIANNVIYGGSRGIRASGAAYNGLTIIGNQISGVAGYGIELASSSWHQVTGNTIRGCTYSGLVLSGSWFNLIQNNRINDNGIGSPTNRAGLMIQGWSSYNNISNNVIGNEASAYSATITSDVSVGGNTIVVTDSAYKFYPNMLITIDDNDSAGEDEVIASVDETTDTITIVGTIAGTYTVAQSAYVVGRAGQGYGILIDTGSTADYNVFKNNNLTSNTRTSGNGGIIYQSGTTGVHNKYDVAIHSAVMDLSNAAEDFPVYTASVPCQLVGYDVYWTEAAGDTNTCTIRVGEIEDTAAVDDDQFDSYTTAGSEALGTMTHVKYIDLTDKKINENHTVTVGHTQKTGNGKVIITLHIVEYAN